MADKPGFEEAALRRIGQQLEPMADAAAGVMGMPPGGTKYSQSEQLETWNYSPIADPRVRVETMLELKALGKTDEEITDALYPKRRQLITTGRPQTAAQIRFAKEMDTLMTKQGEMTGMGLQGQPDQAVGATMPAPTMAPSPTPPAEPVQSFAPEIAPTPAPAPSMLDQPISMSWGG